MRPSRGADPAPIDFRPTNDKRERLARVNGKTSAFVYDIEGEKLTAVQIATRLGKGIKSVQARLGRGQRTWEALTRDNGKANRAKMRRMMYAELEGNRHRVEAHRNGGKA